jgi:hypothetical protein
MTRNTHHGILQLRGCASCWQWCSVRARCPLPRDGERPPAQPTRPWCRRRRLRARPARRLRRGWLVWRGCGVRVAAAMHLLSLRHWLRVCARQAPGTIGGLKHACQHSERLFIAHCACFTSRRPTAAGRRARRGAAMAGQCAKAGSEAEGGWGQFSSNNSTEAKAACGTAGGRPARQRKGERQQEAQQRRRRRCGSERAGNKKNGGRRARSRRAGTGKA